VSRTLAPFRVRIFAFSAGPLLSADEAQIGADQAPNHIGQNVTVSGVVVAVFMSKAGNVFINFGDKYPHQTFTGWVPAGSPFGNDPWLEQLEGKTVKITGIIKIYRRKPEIKITSKDQIFSG
jgi:hypothetical protein